MAGEKIVGFRIEINGTQEQISRMAQIRKELDGLSVDLVKLKGAYQAGAISEQEFNEKAIRLTEQQKSLRTESRNVSTEIQRGNQVFRQQSGSIMELNNALNLNIRKYQEMSAAERNSVSGGQKLLQTIKEQDAQLKQLNATLGRHQANVGNYPNVAGAAFAKVGSMLKTLAAGFIAAFSIQKIGGFFTGSLEKYDKQISAETKLESVLRATGNAVNYTAEELKKMASAMQEATRYGDEEIINAQAVLLTFRSIGHDIFPEVINVAADMTSVLGTDLQGAVLQLGKAFNDPLTGLNALRRAGVSFTKEQKEHIQTLTETGHLYEAQKLILEELKLEFGGTAEAMAGVGKGPLKQLSNLWGDFMEKIGGSIATGGAFSGLISTLTDFSRWMGKNVDSVVAIIKVLGGLLTALVVYKVAAMASAAATKIWNDAQALSAMWMKTNTAATKTNIVATNLQTTATVTQAAATEGAAVAQKSLNTAVKQNPVGLLLAVIVAVGIAIYEMVSALKKAETGFSKFQKNLHEETMAMNYAFESLKRTTEGTKERAEAVKLINEKYGEYLPNLLNEKSSLDEITKTQQAATRALAANIAMKAKEQEMTEIMSKYADEIKKYNDKIIAAVNDQWGEAAGGVLQARLMQVFDRLKNGSDVIRVSLGGAVTGTSAVNNAVAELANGLSGGTIKADQWSDALANMIYNYQQQQSEISKLSSFYDGYIGIMSEVTKATKDLNSADDPDKPDKKTEKEITYMKVIEANHKEIIRLRKLYADNIVAEIQNQTVKEIEEEENKFQSIRELNLTNYNEREKETLDAIDKLAALGNKRNKDQEDEYKLLFKQLESLRVDYDNEFEAEERAHQVRLKKVFDDASIQQLEALQTYLEEKGEKESDLYSETTAKIAEKRQAAISEEKKAAQESINLAEQKAAGELSIIDGLNLDKEQRAKAENAVQLAKYKAQYDALEKLYMFEYARGINDADTLLRLKNLMDEINKLMESGGDGDGKGKGGSLANKADRALEKLLGLKEGELDGVTARALKLVTDISNILLKGQQERITQQLDREIRAIDTEQKTAEEKLKKSLDNQLITQQEYEKRMKALDESTRARKNAADKKAFEDMKDKKQSELWINAALASIVALATAGNIYLGIAEAAAVLIMAGVESANIDKEQWTPKYESGGPIPGASGQEVPITAHAGEVVLNPKSMASRDTMTVTGTPYQIASQLNAYKNYGIAFDNKPRHRMMSGGLVIPSAPVGRSATVSDAGMLQFARYIVAGINDKMVVVEKDITDTQKKAKIREADSSW